MPQSSLKFVRKDSTHVVLTEHPDFIHPRDLSETLAARFGDKQFRISLRKNIYVIYVNAEAAGKHFSPDIEVLMAQRPFEKAVSPRFLLCTALCQLYQLQIAVGSVMSRARGARLHNHAT
ncbi:hypothetical protein F4818DRAFT_235663 [Hypoxylon cercidicola]|nr:hypothetical protein F4818DRAFT_235663 [Hypoxylon cercidicola]